MTTGSRRERPGSGLRIWAAKQLNVSPSAPVPEVRAAYLRLLAAEEFVPEPEKQHAALVLLGRAPSAPAKLAALREAEERWRVEVEAFAASFFATPLDGRRRRWQELLDRCKFSVRLTARLRQLEPGVPLEVPATGGPDARTGLLAEHVRELFVLRPAERAFRRQQLVQGMRGDMAAWQQAAGRFQKQQPAWAALEADWVALLAQWGKQQKIASKPRQQRARPPAASSGGGHGNWPWWGFGMLVFLVLRLIVGGVGSWSSSSPPTFPRQAEQPALKLPPRNQPANPSLPRTAEELRKALEDPKLSRKDRDKLRDDLLRQRLERQNRQGASAPPAPPKKVP